MLTSLLRALTRPTRRVATDSAHRVTPLPSDEATVPASNSAAPHISLGNSLLSAGRLDAAAQCYQSAIDAEPKHADAHLNLGFVLSQQGRDDEAVVPLQRAIELRPEFFDAHYLLGISYSSLGAIALAIRHFERALALKPD